MQNRFHHSSFIIHHSSRAGFTLIEILMAIGILVVGLTGVIALYAVAVDAHRATVEQAGAASLAESMLSGITADFTARDVDLDSTASFVESFVDLCTRYKAIREKDDGSSSLLSFIPERGVAAPNAPGFNCEVSIYPLPRRLWVEDLATAALPETDDELQPFDPSFRVRLRDPDTKQRTWEEFLFDQYICSLPSSLPDAEKQDLGKLLAQALEYKLVVKTIRGEGKHKQVEVFETIITPRGRVE
ncbi:MAG TPA: prepilin-type N-terminal cleavage/methylation domain-containing protein [Planctomycetota bacterium]|nr:prepilin-type N-terminal cleavage/methylation domain-containing protein [Planctomycetota bacterium]